MRSIKLPSWEICWLSGWFIAAGWALTLGGEVPHRLSEALRGAASEPPFGTDGFGRPLLQVALRASVLSAVFALATALIASAAGAFLGSALAVTPRRLRAPMLRALDFLLAFPSLILAFALAAILGPGWDTLILALCLGALPSFVRLAYLRADEVAAEDFVQASRSIGAGPLHLLLRHLGPEVLVFCRVKFASLFAHALMAEATLSFLGVGAPIGADTWGSLLIQGKDYLVEAPHVAFASGLPLVLTVAALQRISDRHSRPARPKGILKSA
ncbi:MAG: ABC transporter permease [Bdellovibrionales bacterium]|nr:ABC transporter permease [Bdellovibrionales bacterium]